MPVPLPICVMQPMLPVAMACGARRLDVGDLAVAQLRGDLRLEDVVGAGRAAAEMAFRHVHDGEAGAAQQLLRLGLDLLAMLHGAGGMIGELQAALGLRQVLREQEFGDVLRLGADRLGLLRIGGIEPQHVAIVLDGGAAARGGDDHGIDIGLGPLVDGAAGAGQRILLLAHVVGERAAAGLLARRPRPRSRAGSAAGWWRH